MIARRRWGATTIRTVFGLMVVVAATGQSEEPRVPEVVYRGEMVSYPGPWALTRSVPRWMTANFVTWPDLGVLRLHGKEGLHYVQAAGAVP